MAYTPGLQEGSDVTGATLPAGGASGRGWLSAIWQALTGGSGGGGAPTTRASDNRSEAEVRDVAARRMLELILVELMEIKEALRK